MEHEAQHENTYIFDPNSPVEMARLIDLHRATTKAMGGPLVGVPAMPEGAKVLDLACGPGGWVLDVAFARSGWEVAGIDISEVMIEYAIARARTQQLSNASFGVMDITQPLDFSDNTFDLVNARFLGVVLLREAWTALLAECMRILKPGGTLRLTEPVDMGGMTSSAAYEQSVMLVHQAMKRAGYGFSVDGRTSGLTMALPRLLRRAGYENVHFMAHMLEFSSECEAWQDLYRNAQASGSLVMDFFVNTGVATRQEVEQITRQVQIDMLSDEFCGMWHFATFVGTKP